MKTYSTKSNAVRAAKKALAKEADAHDYTVMPAPEGGWFFELNMDGGVSGEELAIDTGRGGGKKFMTGRYVRRTLYKEETIGDTLFRCCAYLASEMDLQVPYRAHVEELAVRLGIKPSTARAAYTHFKQVYGLDVKMGRPDEEADAKFAELATKFEA